MDSEDMDREVNPWAYTDDIIAGILVAGYIGGGYLGKMLVPEWALAAAVVYSLGVDVLGYLFKEK